MKREHDNAHGISPREQAILTLHEDEGCAPRIISERLDVKLIYVRKVIAMYRVTGREERAHAAAAAMSNRAMVAAIAASGGRFR